MVTVNTVDGEEERLSRREQEGTALDKRYYGTMGFTSSRDFKNMVHSTLISNLPNTPDDIITTKKIYGPNIHPLKVNTVRRQPTPVVKDYSAMQPGVLKEHVEVTAAVDLMCINNLEFVVSTSRGVRLTMEEYVKNRYKSMLLAPIKFF